MGGDSYKKPLGNLLSGNSYSMTKGSTDITRQIGVTSGAHTPTADKKVTRSEFRGWRRKGKRSDDQIQTLSLEPIQPFNHLTNINHLNQHKENNDRIF